MIVGPKEHKTSVTQRAIIEAALEFYKSAKVRRRNQLLASTADRNVIKPRLDDVEMKLAHVEDLLKEFAP